MLVDIIVEVDLEFIVELTNIDKREVFEVEDAKV